MLISFSSIEELVKPNNNGLLFTGPEELCEQLLTLLAGFPTPTNPLLQTLKRNVQDFRRSTWHENWKSVALPLIKSSVEQREKDRVPLTRRISYIAVAFLIIPLSYLIKLIFTAFSG